MPPEQPRHLDRRLQVAFGIGLQPPPRLVDGRPLADTGQDVLQRPPLGVVVQDRIGRDHGRARAMRHGRQPVQTPAVIPPPQRRRRQIQVVRPAPTPRRQPGFEGRVGAFRRGGERDHAFAHGRGLFEGQPRLGLCDAFRLGIGARLRHNLALAQRQQPAQPAIGRPVAREDDQLRPVGEAQPRPDDEGEVDVLRPHQRPHHPRQRIAVRHADGGQTQRLRLHHQLARMRRPLQKAEIGHGPELGVPAIPANHGSTPCIHHEGARSPGSPENSRPYSPSRNSQ